jgi:hypothetical protein
VTTSYAWVVCVRCRQAVESIWLLTNPDPTPSTAPMLDHWRHKPTCRGASVGMTEVKPLTFDHLASMRALVNAMEGRS